MPPINTVRIRGAVLRDLRTRRGVTNRSLAQKIGRSQKSLERLERDEGKPLSLVFAYQIANALGIKVSDFTDYTEAEAEAEQAEAAAPAGAAALRP
jgi:transcriptional regulator with XRE-family HTH domain